MRAALFALPAIAIGLILVAPSPLNVVGIALLVGWGLFELVILVRRWRQGGLRSTEEVSNGVVSMDCEQTLKMVLDALPKAGVRWVRVGRSPPTTVRAGTGKKGSAGVDEIELVLKPITPATTELRFFGPPAQRSTSITPRQGGDLIQRLRVELGLPSA